MTIAEILTSIADKIASIGTNISSAYTKIEDKGGTMPTEQTSENLATAIDSIPAGGGLDTNGSTIASGYDTDFCTPFTNQKGLVRVIDKGTITMNKVAFACCTLLTYYKGENVISLDGLDWFSQQSGSWFFKLCENLKELHFPNCTTIKIADRRYGVFGHRLYKLECLELGAVTDSTFYSNTSISAPIGISGINSEFNLRGCRAIKFAQGWNIWQSHENYTAALDLTNWTATDIPSSEDATLNANLVNYIAATYGGTNAHSIRLNALIVNRLTEETIAAFTEKNLTIVSV